MCNLWKGERLFLISNPCCCCSLRCGTIWICVISFASGIISSWVPRGLGLKWEYANSSQTTESPNTNNKVYKPPIQAPTEWKWVGEHVFVNFFHFGALMLQVVTAALLLIVILTRAGGFLNFIAGTCWMVGRFLITVVWTPVLYKLLVESTVGKDDDDEEAKQARQWIRYSWFLMANVFVHIYFFVAVRFYTMESYDAWIYRPVTPQLGIRERVAGNNQRTRGRRDTRRNIRSWKQSQMVSRLREGHEAMTPVPVWRLHNKFTVHGEDYEPMDPARFLVNWNLINAKLGDENEEPEKKKRRVKENEDEQKEIAVVGPVHKDILEIVDEVKQVKKFKGEGTAKKRSSFVPGNSVFKSSQRISRQSEAPNLNDMEAEVKAPIKSNSKTLTAKATRSVKAHTKTGDVKVKALKLQK